MALPQTNLGLNAIRQEVRNATGTAESNLRVESLAATESTGYTGLNDAPYGMGEFRGYASQMPYIGTTTYGPTTGNYVAVFAEAGADQEYFPFGVIQADHQIVQSNANIGGTYYSFWYVEEVFSGNPGITYTSTNNGQSMNTGQLYPIGYITFSSSDWPTSYYIDHSVSQSISNANDADYTTNLVAGSGEDYTSGTNWDSTVYDLLAPGYNGNATPSTAFRIRDSIAASDYGSYSGYGIHTFNFYYRRSGYPDFKAFTLKTYQEIDYTLSYNSGGCPLCCVHDSMLIATEEDMKSIYDIQIGDKVISHNFETGQDEVVEVTDLIIVDRDVDYKVNDLVMTEDHPVYLEGGRKASVNPDATLLNYKQEVDQLVVGDKMMKLDGSLEEITSIERFEGEHKNFAVQTKHNNFYANGHLVDSVINRGEE